MRSRHGSWDEREFWRLGWGECGWENQTPHPGEGTKQVWAWPRSEISLGTRDLSRPPLHHSAHSFQDNCSLLCAGPWTGQEDRRTKLCPLGPHHLERATESGLGQSDWDDGMCARVRDRGVRRSQALGGGREGFPGEVTPVLRHERGSRSWPGVREGEGSWEGNAVISKEWGLRLTCGTTSNCQNRRLSLWFRDRNWPSLTL